MWYAGYFYTRRDLEPNPRMKLAAAVKYSRGAKSTDPPDIVEEGDGSFRYVTLAVFRGDGRRREEYAMPSAAVAPRAERGKPPSNGASAGAAVP